jgi:hypothetical protein
VFVLFLRDRQKRDFFVLGVTLKDNLSTNIPPILSTIKNFGRRHSTYMLVFLVLVLLLLGHVEQKAKEMMSLPIGQSRIRTAIDTVESKSYSVIVHQESHLFVVLFPMSPGGSIAIAPIASIRKIVH